MDDTTTITTDSFELIEETASALSAIPSAIGDYRVVRQLGEGGMGVVYEGRAPDGTRVAIKTLHARLAKHPVHAERLRREVRAAQKIVHPNLVQIFHAGEWDGAPFVVMEYLSGETLADWIERVPRTSLRDAAEIIVPLAAALKELHAAGVVHRDIKPENIFLAEDAGAVVPMFLDFGLSKLSDDVAGLTRTRTIVGTPLYMSPEHAISASKVGPASDVYCLGVVLYEMVVGRHPIRQDETILAVINAILHEPVPPPEQFAPDLPAPIVVLLGRLLDKRADRRATATDLVLGLLPFASQSTRDRFAGFVGDPSDALTPRRSSLPPAPDDSPPRWLPVAALATLGVVAALTAYIAFASFAPTPPVAAPSPTPSARVVAVPDAPPPPDAAVRTLDDLADAAPPRRPQKRPPRHDENTMQTWIPPLKA